MSVLPEELIERILEHVVPSPRPHWLRSPTRLAALSVSRQYNRIATPLLYHAVHLTGPRDAALLVRTLRARPHYARHIRELVVHRLCAPVADVLAVAQSLTSLDLAMAFDDDVELDTVLAALADMRHLTLRKPSSVYLSLPRARALIVSIAHAIPAWPRLRTAHLAFKLSDDTPTSPTLALALPPAPPPSGPISSLATALAASPALQVFSTHLPSVWNTAIPTIAANPALQRISLAHPTAPAPAAIPGTGLFLMEARRHPRLADLIAAGTPIIRSRAHTLGTRVSHDPTPAAKPTVALGLRIDTSDDAIGAGAQYASPGASSAGAVNPAWMGASVQRKGKRRARTRG